MEPDICRGYNGGNDCEGMIGDGLGRLPLGACAYDDSGPQGAAMSTVADQPWARHIKPVSAEHLAGDQIQRGHPLFGLVWINRQRMSGAPCFYASRVPIQTLFDYLESGQTLDEFLEDFEGISREQAVGVLEMARAGLLAELPKA